MSKKKGRPTWFKLFLHQKNVVDSVSDETAGKALKACFQYFADGEIPELDQMAFVVFASIKPYIDESYADYERSVESGRQGGLARQANKEAVTTP